MVTLHKSHRNYVQLLRLSTITTTTTTTSDVTTRGVFMLMERPSEWCFCSSLLDVIFVAGVCWNRVDTQLKTNLGGSLSNLQRCKLDGEGPNTVNALMCHVTVAVRGARRLRVREIK